MQPIRVEEIVLFSYLITCILANYKHVSLSSPEVCLPSHLLQLPHQKIKEIYLDKGTAAILTIQVIKKTDCVTVWFGYLTLSECFQFRPAMERFHSVDVI